MRLVAVGRRRPRVNHSAYARVTRRDQYIERTNNIHHVSFDWTLDRERNARKRRDVKYTIDVLECRAYRSQFPQIRLDQFRPRIDLLSPASREIINYADAQTAFQ